MSPHSLKIFPRRNQWWWLHVSYGMRIWKAKVISMRSGKYVNTSPRCENVYRIVNNLIPWILISHKQHEKICRKTWRYIFTYVDKYMCKKFNPWDTWMHQAMVDEAHLMQTTKKHFISSAYFISGVLFQVVSFFGMTFK